MATERPFTPGVYHPGAWRKLIDFGTGTLGDIRPKVKAAGFTRTALILLGPALRAADFRDSVLYDGAHPHILRPRRTG